MELESWNASLLHVVIDQLCVLPVNSWLDVLSIYRQSRIVGHWNRLAAEGLAFFCRPADIEEAVLRDRTLRWRRVDGAMQVCLNPRAAKPALSRSLASVLRYEVSEWIKVPSIVALLNTRRTRTKPYSHAEILQTLLLEQDRFEVCFWQGETWAQATYRY